MTLASAAFGFGQPLRPNLVDSDSDCESNSESESSQERTAKPLRFMDGVLEHYMNRPVDADGQAEYWETMCY